MNYHFYVKNCSVCPFFRFSTESFCWLNDDEEIIVFNFQELPVNCPLLKYTQVQISPEA